MENAYEFRSMNGSDFTAVMKPITEVLGSVKLAGLKGNSRSGSVTIAFERELRISEITKLAKRGIEASTLAL